MTSSTQETTAEECEALFRAALKAGDMKGAAAAVRALAVRDPERAQMVVDAMAVSRLVQDNEHLSIKSLPSGNVRVGCTQCQLEVDAPPSFGIITQAVMVKTFLEQHTHDKKKRGR